MLNMERLSGNKRYAGTAAVVTRVAVQRYNGTAVQGDKGTQP